MAWNVGRGEAVARLAKHSADKAGAVNDQPFERAADARVPADCPYLLEHVAGYDPKRGTEPDYGVYPPAVVKVLERSLWGKREIHRSGPGRYRG